MASKKEFELAIKIAGMIDESLNNACKLTTKQLRGIAKEAADANSSTVSFGTAMENAGDGIDGAWNLATGAVKLTAGAMTAAAGAAGIVGGAAIEVGKEFESAFAGVKKTVNATDEQLEDLEEGLRLMAKNKPQTAVELAEIAEAAGQLGIKTENIEDFVSTMADLKESTNLGDEGAEQFAKFANIVGMSQDQFDNLGSAVVALGNNSATTEADIMAMAMRVAGAGHQVGMSEADILGFSAALSSVGIEAEAGGSAISKVMVNMQLAAEKGGESLNQFAKVAGMSSQDFKKAFKEDAAGAVSSFIIGLSDTERLGQSAIAVLDDMDIKEVRLRDTLLRGANASELFADTLELSTRAFEENTALSREAEQRYATFESRLGMLNNRIKDVGITLYQDFSGGLSEALGAAMDFVDNTELLDTDFLQGLADNFEKSIPTIKRNLEDAGEKVGNFAKGVMELGDWMIEHGDVIGGGLAAIGTTIATMKLAKTVTGVATAINGLRIAMMSNPIMAAIGLTALAGGALAGLSTQIKIAKEKAKKQKLNEAFGDITLSIEELKEAARQIVGEKDLENFAKAMEEIEKVSDISDGIEKSAQTIDRMIWKVGVGIQLTDTDKESFKAAIDNTVQDSIALVEQAQYTAQISINTLFGESDATGNLILQGLNAMYGNINTEVSRLGKELGEKYSEAMGDGIIDIDEAEAIRGMQEKLAKITEEVTASQLEAKLERIQLQYSGKELDAETFQNLQAEIQGTLSEMSAAASKSYDYTLSGLKLQLDRSRSGEIAITDPEYLTQTMYDQAKEQLDAQLLEKQLEIDAKGMRFQTDSIIEAFDETVGEIVPQMGENLGTAMRETINYIGWSKNALNAWDPEQVTQWLGLDELDQATRDAISELWKGMEPDFNDLVKIKRQYEAAGAEIPTEIVEGINKAATIGILAGSTDALWVAMGETARTSPEYEAALTSMMESGVYVVDTLAEGIESNEKTAKQGIENLHKVTDMELRKTFNDFTVNPRLFINYSVSETFSPLNSPEGSKINGYATGGIVEGKQLAWIAEEGPEAIIPLDGSQNAKSIWEEIGERMGLLEEETGTGGTGAAYTADAGNSNAYHGNTSANNESQIIYSPTYQIYGATEETVRRATNDDYAQFEAFMRRHEKDKARLSFKGG
jgi:TP901 family phage tail tape measure protein